MGDKVGEKIYSRFCKALRSFTLREKGKPLEGFEQKSDML